MLIVVTVTKFTHGAWLVFVLMPVLFLLMIGVHRYYRDVEKEIEVDPDDHVRLGGDDHAIVLVGRMQKPTLKALDYAIAARHETRSRPCTSRWTMRRPKRLQKQWVKQNIHVPLAHHRVAVPRPQLPADPVHQGAPRGARL